MLEKLRQIENRYSELESKLADPAYYSDPAVFTKLCREQRELQPVVETYRAYTACQGQIAQAEALLSDPELHEIAREEIDLGRARCAELEQQLRVLLLPRDPNDDRNVILEIRTGVGGEESALFAHSLYRMYNMYADAHGWKTEIANLNETELGGVREASLLISGQGAYSRLKFESGVHRVQRVPETETGGRIHTSTATVAVLPEMDAVEVHIDPKDLQIDTYRSSGAPSPKTADDVLAYFNGQIAAVIDGGPCGIGRESTLVDLSHTPYRILRSAAVPDDAVWDALVRKMHIVGITGGTGCGKTTALMELERQGALVIDCDAVYHELLASNTAMLAEINARFPGTIENGTLQRKRLGAVVFADAAALDDLNAITHRYVRAEVCARLRAWARQGGTVAAIDAIALIESGLAELCTVTIGVTAPREVRIERLIAREGVTRDYAEARIDAQKPNEWFAQHCSYVLDNGGTLADFQRRCHQLIQEVLS